MFASYDSLTTKPSFDSVTLHAHQLTSSRFVLVCRRSMPYADVCTQEQEDGAQLWKYLMDLQPDEPIPHNMPELFYTRLQMLVKCSQYADRIYPFLQQFPINK